MAVTVTNQWATGAIGGMHAEVRVTVACAQATQNTHWYRTHAVGLQGTPAVITESEVSLNYMRKLNSYLTENKTLRPL